ncbi:metal ABC transporter solute-binding protein, Zn/Mn family [Fructobacillus ficulneus]|uniref:ABC transporter substrate binding protein n=1 Tax=Fructobacillus ficulneus TaxID=157463 RepID=A0A0K8MG24_9LACO|nr:zinc ABC transporter substrate-binding protein [Fructobacillus ficulneus]GAO99471.1 ABC transporter substrate binding protein [Fructobacillus ficulneus]
MQKKKTTTVVGVLVLILITIFALVLWQGSGKKSDKKSNQLTIVTSTNVYAELAKTVAGSHADVSAVITKQSVSPEDYEPTNSVAKKISKADIVFGNGLGYDAWLKKLAKTSNTTQVLYTGDDILHAKAGSNPHLWNNPDNMIQAAQGLADVLSQKDPKHKADYQANAKAYAAKLKPVTEKIATLKAAVAGKEVMETEPVYEYMLEALGANIVGGDFAESIEEGNDPSPAVLTDIQSKIKNHELAFLVYNTQTTGGTVDKIVKLAKDNNIPIVKVTETSPENVSYVNWKLSELNQIQKIVDKNK